MAERLWGYEAICGRCGEVYMPHSLHTEDIYHWCDDEVLGRPDQVWKLTLHNGQLARREVKPRTRLINWKANVAALLLIIGLTAWLVWIAL